MANRPKGSVLRTSVIQAKLTPQIYTALDQYANSQSKSISTVVYELVDEKLQLEGLVKSND
mgnify:CR=1 FL=1|jgi:hypothetical protein|tara:strand:- start:1357 stop:1539 length:183 start_codon:yes stop_codon:yes gene_type:complete